jgi:hypothetical protein
MFRETESLPIIYVASVQEMGCNEKTVTALDDTGKPHVQNQRSGQHITFPVYELFNDAGCISDRLLIQEKRRMWKDRIFPWLEVCSRICLMRITGSIKHHNEFLSSPDRVLISAYSYCKAEFYY